MAALAAVCVYMCDVVCLCFRFPVQSMVMEPDQGKVLNGLNANELLDNLEEASVFDKLL